MAVSVPALITVTKAVAGLPTRTDRLLGRIDANTGTSEGPGGPAGPRNVTPPKPTPPSMDTSNTVAPALVNGGRMNAVCVLAPPPVRIASWLSGLIAIWRKFGNSSGDSAIFSVGDEALNGAEMAHTASPFWSTTSAFAPSGVTAAPARKSEPGTGSTTGLVPGVGGLQMFTCLLEGPSSALPSGVTASSLQPDCGGSASVNARALYGGSNTAMRAPLAHECPPTRGERDRDRLGAARQRRRSAEAG